MANLLPLFEKRAEPNPWTLELRKCSWSKIKAKKTVKSTLMENLLPMFEKENRRYSMDRLSLRKNACGQKPFLAKSKQRPNQGQKRQ